VRMHARMGADRRVAPTGTATGCVRASAWVVPASGLPGTLSMSASAIHVLASSWRALSHAARFLATLSKYEARLARLTACRALPQ
jgi:hypothetical protein